MQSKAEQAEAFKNQNEKLQIIAATLKQQLEAMQRDFVALNSIKNNYAVLQTENQNQKVTITTLETQLADLNNCTKNLKDERSRNDKNKNDLDKVNKDFESLSAESLKVRQGLDKCQNDLNNV